MHHVSLQFLSPALVMYGMSQLLGPVLGKCPKIEIERAYSVTDVNGDPLYLHSSPAPN